MRLDLSSLPLLRGTVGVAATRDYPVPPCRALHAGNCVPCSAQPGPAALCSVAALGTSTGQGRSLRTWL